jgi:hypothetical protein
MLQDEPFGHSTTRIRPSINGGQSTITTRVTTLERRENNTHQNNYHQILSHNNYSNNSSDKLLIESALDNTEKIVANILANASHGKRQVVLKERKTPCYVVL